MALKTINLHGCIGVTAVAKMSVVLEVNRLAIITLDDMAINAILQAVLSCTNPVMHRLVTLMHDVFHMLETNNLFRGHALVTFDIIKVW